MLREFTISTEEAMMALGYEIGKNLEAGTVIYLTGPLGAGKTTLVRGILKALNYPGKVKSPTYTLIEPYTLPQFTLYHFDLYRLNHPSELEDIGSLDYFDSSSVCLVEWPEKGDLKLPSADLACYIEFKQAERKLTLEAHSLRGEKLLKRL